MTIGEATAIEATGARCFAPSRRERFYLSAPSNTRQATIATLRAYVGAVVAVGEGIVADAKGVLDAYHNTHRYGVMSGTGVYEFNIKVHAFPPGWATRGMGETSAYEYVGEEASTQLHWAVDRLQDEYPWIARDWCTAGRSGGWLLLSDDAAPVEHYDDALHDLGATARHGDSGAIHEAVRVYRDAVDALRARARDLPEIEQDLRAGVAGFERMVTYRSFWEGVVPRNRLRRRRHARGRAWRRVRRQPRAWWG